MIVLDSNVISELMRTAPDPQVLKWVDGQPSRDLGTTAVTVAEVRYGIARLPAGRRRTRLRDVADRIFTSFAEYILPFDHDASRHYADIIVEREKRGLPISGFDAQIAAICRSRELGLATRNTRDFETLKLRLFDPWRS